MRKRTILALCLVFALVFSALPAMAAGYVNAWLSADRTSVSAGSTITVTVSAEVDSCGSGGVSVSFDSSVFEMTGGSCTLSGTDLSYFDPATRDGAFAFSDNKAISGSVFQFTLQVKSGAKAGSHSVSATFLADGTSVSRSITITLACDHTYDNGCDETCNRCGASREVSHQYDGGKVTTPATCSKEGVKTYTCTSCGKTKTEAISKTSHSWDSGKVTREPTCSRPGEKFYTCTVCGATTTEETDTLRHNYEVTGYVPATCEENGEMSFVCVDCGYSYDDYIEATGHRYENDCDEECDTCGGIREVEHNYDQAPWLSDKDGHWMECQDCKKPQEPTPHTPGPEATETDDQVCLDCGFVIKPAIAHVHKPATLFESDGQQHWFRCACGEVMGLSDHRWEDKGIEGDRQTYKCIICSAIRTETVPTEPPTEATTLPPTEEATEASTAAADTSSFHPINIGIPVYWWWLIPAAVLALAFVGFSIYVIVGLIVAFRKPGKYDAKKKQ